MYVIVNDETGKYVSKPGSEHSYTNKLEHARIFKSESEGIGNKCGNETVKRVDLILS